MKNAIDLEKLDEELAFKITTDNREIICYVLLNFYSPETNKKYVIYTDGTKNQDGTMEILASTYDIVDGKIKLGYIETEEEWDLIDKVLAQRGENNE